MTSRATFSLGLSRTGYRDWQKDNPFIVHRMKNYTRTFCGKRAPYTYSYLPSKKQILCDVCRKCLGA